MFKTSVRLLFNLFGCFSNTKTCVQNKQEAAFNLFGYFSNTKKCMFKTSGGERWEMLLNLLPNFQKGLQSNLPLYRLYPASLLSLLLLPGSLLQDTLLFNLDWFEQLFAQQLTSFVLLKFSLLNYELNKVCMIKM